MFSNRSFSAGANNSSPADGLETTSTNSTNNFVSGFRIEGSIEGSIDLDRTEFRTEGFTVTGFVGGNQSLGNIFIDMSITIDRLINRINTDRIEREIYLGVSSTRIVLSEITNTYMGDILLSEVVAKPNISWYRDTTGNCRQETDISVTIPPNINCLLKKDFHTSTLVKINSVEISAKRINELKDGQIVLVKSDSESNVSFEIASKSINDILF